MVSREPIDKQSVAVHCAEQTVRNISTIGIGSIFQVMESDGLLAIEFTSKHDWQHDLLPRPFLSFAFQCCYVVVPEIRIPARALPIYDTRYMAFVDEDVLRLQVAV